MTPDFTERVRGISPQRLDLLLHRLNALRPAPAEGIAVARESGPSAPPPETWSADPFLVPLRFRGALDPTALRRVLAGLAGELGDPPPAAHELDLRGWPVAERYGEALRAAGAHAGEADASDAARAAAAAGDGPVRAVLARLGEAEYVAVLVLRPADVPPVGALVRQLKVRYDELVRRQSPQPEMPQPQARHVPLPAQTPEDLLAGVESFSDEDVELLLGQLESGAGLRVARDTSVPVDSASAEALLAEIDQLADDDVDALLAQLSDV